MKLSVATIQLLEQIIYEESRLTETAGFRLGADGKGMCPINGVMASPFGKAPWRSHLAQVKEREK
jgi:hypothetical protein